MAQFLFWFFIFPVDVFFGRKSHFIIGRAHNNILLRNARTVIVIENRKTAGRQRYFRFEKGKIVIDPEKNPSFS